MWDFAQDWVKSDLLFKIAIKQWNGIVITLLTSSEMSGHVKVHCEGGVLKVSKSGKHRFTVLILIIDVKL